jgi:hypothetical protein
MNANVVVKNCREEFDIHVMKDMHDALVFETGLR